MKKKDEARTVRNPYLGIPYSVISHPFSQLGSVIMDPKEEERRLKEFLQIMSDDFKKQRRIACYEKINNNIINANKETFHGRLSSMSRLSKPRHTKMISNAQLISSRLMQQSNEVDLINDSETEEEPDVNSKTSFSMESDIMTISSQDESLGSISRSRVHKMKSQFSTKENNSIRSIEVKNQ